MSGGSHASAAHAFLHDVRAFRASCAAVRAAFMARKSKAKPKAKRLERHVEFFALLVLLARGVSAAICAADETTDADVAFVRAHDTELDTIMCAAAGDSWWATLQQWCLQAKTCRRAARRFLRYGLRPLCKQLLSIEERRGRHRGALARYLALVCGAPIHGSAHYSLVRKPEELEAEAQSRAQMHPHMETGSGIGIGPATDTGTDVDMDAIAAYVHVKCFAGCTCELIKPSMERLDAVMRDVRASAPAHVVTAIQDAMEAAAMKTAPQMHHEETTLPRALLSLLELLMAATAAGGSTGFS